MKILGLISCSFVYMFLISWAVVSFLPALPLGIFAIGLSIFGNCFRETNELVVALPPHITNICMSCTFKFVMSVYNCTVCTTRVLQFILLSTTSELILALKRVMSVLVAVTKIVSIFGMLLPLAYFVLQPLGWLFGLVTLKSKGVFHRKFSIAWNAINDLGPLIVVVLTSQLPVVSGMLSAKFDPTKKIPVLTSSNFSEWAWRISTVFISLGVGSNLLTMWQPQQDVAAEHVHKDGLYIENDDIKQAKADLRAKKLKKTLHIRNADPAEEKREMGEINDDIAVAEDGLAAFKTKAIRDFEDDQEASNPFKNLTESTKTQCFRILATTISTDLDFLIMNFLPVEFDKAWFAVRDYFCTNTRGARMEMKINFFKLEMSPEMKFAQFKNRIEYDARQLNSMVATSVVISEDDKTTVLLRGVRKHHNSTFKTTLEILEQDTTPLKFEEAYKKMLVCAKQHEAQSTVESEQAFSVQEMKVDKKPCFAFQRGNCRYGTNCKYAHSSVNHGSSHRTNDKQTDKRYCNYCQRPNHLERDCRKKAADQKRRQGNKNSSESAALASAKKEIAKLKKNYKS